MKILAIAFFASLAVGCATDEQDIRPIDKTAEETRDLDSVAEELRDRAGQVLVPPGVGLQEGGGQWAEELIVDGRQWTIVHGPKGVDAIIDELGNPLKQPELQESSVEAIVDALGVRRPGLQDKGAEAINDQLGNRRPQLQRWPE